MRFAPRACIARRAPVNGVVTCVTARWGGNQGLNLGLADDQGRRCAAIADHVKFVVWREHIQRCGKLALHRVKVAGCHLVVAYNSAVHDIGLFAAHCWIANKMA